MQRGWEPTRSSIQIEKDIPDVIALFELHFFDFVNDIIGCSVRQSTQQIAAFSRGSQFFVRA